jgi:hypothetical protein
MRRTELVLTALWLGFGICLSGCTAVAPWERGHLAKPHMALEPDPMQRSLREHVYGGREATGGSGKASGGGGCGCY